MSRSLTKFAKDGYLVISGNHNRFRFWLAVTGLLLACLNSGVSQPIPVFLYHCPLRPALQYFTELLLPLFFRGICVEDTTLHTQYEFIGGVERNLVTGEVQRKQGLVRIARSEDSPHTKASFNSFTVIIPSRQVSR